MFTKLQQQQQLKNAHCTCAAADKQCYVTAPLLTSAAVTVTVPQTHANSQTEQVYFLFLDEEKAVISLATLKQGQSITF